MINHDVLKTKLRLLLPVFLLCAMPLVAQAQTPTVSIDVKNVSVKQMLQSIEENSQYTFAYIDSAIDTDKIVSVSGTNRSIASIIAEVLPDAQIEVMGTQIILKTTQKQRAAQGQSQQDGGLRTVKGRVIDEDGDPVIGAAVILKGTMNGVATDLDGNYSIVIDRGNAVLNVSFIGYETAEVNLTDIQTSANVVLKNEITTLESSVVVGYGVQNRRDLTTSISSMTSDDFATIPTADFRDAMAAKMPGVQVFSLGGQPEGNMQVRIRGIQSATAGNDPLYVIDGIPCDSRAFANIDSNDIESLEVLKDASAAAIYGSRGSCGVVLITTKRGNSGSRPVVTYDGQVGVSTVSKKLDMMNAYEWATFYKEARDGCYLTNVPTGSIDDPYENRPETYHRVDPLATAYLLDTTGTLTDTDWQDEIFQTAITTKHSLSVSGQSNSLKYYIGANYLYREGVIIGSDFQRYALRVNLDGSRNRLKYGVSFSPSYSKTNEVDSDGGYGAGGIIQSALMCPPIFSPYNDDGTYNWDMNGWLNRNAWNTNVNSVVNAVAYALEVKDVREKMNLMGNAYASYEFIDGLEYKITVGGDYYSYIRNYYRPSSLPLRGDTYYHDASQPDAENYNTSYFHWTISNQLSYNKVIGDHSINAVAVYEAEKETTHSSQIVSTGDIGDDKIQTTLGKTLDTNSTYNNTYAYTFSSWLVRLQYSYKSRYLISASIRGDASSRFAPNTRWGYFPAVSLGWRISDENFMRKATWLDDLKIRASMGQTGNAQIGDSEYLALYSMSTTDLGNGVTSMIYPSQIANNDLSWEKTTQYDVGLDATLWKGYFGLTADYYYSKTTNMLFDVPVSSVSGLTESTVNIGSMQNTGVELVASSRHRFGDFSYDISVNWTLNRNKVLSLGNENADIIKEGSGGIGSYYITRVGYPIGSYYILVADGIFHNQQELDSYPHFDSTVVGDYKFVDVNGDGIMEQDEDRAIVGNYLPDFYYGFSINLAWKGIDLQANFQGVYGNEIMNLFQRFLLNMEGSSGMLRKALDRYPYGEMPRANRKTTGNNEASVSTAKLEDGSYLRLQNLSIGYTFPERWFRKARISKLRVYLQGTNLFTLTNYTGYNPEVSKYSTDPLRPGEDYGAYPLSRSYLFGVTINL